MLANLSRDRFEARDIYIDKSGQWHDRGRPTTPHCVLQQVDVVLNGLHGEYGEDGEVQKLLEKFAVPYTGADSFGSYMATHKVMSKAKAKEAGLLTPDFRHVERADDAVGVTQEAMRSFMQPLVVKPVGWGSSIGVSVVGGYDAVLKAVQKLFEEGTQGVLIEERIRGREATAGIVEGLRDEAYYQLPVIASGLTRVEIEELRRAAKIIHRALGLRHYSESDFIVSPRGVYYLETNSLPSLASDAYLPRSLTHVGVRAPDFFSHLISLAKV